MSDFLMPIAGGLLYLLLAPILGGLLSGCDRIISARMQRRKGPPLLQPFYDFLNLMRRMKQRPKKMPGIRRIFIWAPVRMSPTEKLPLAR